MTELIIQAIIAIGVIAQASIAFSTMSKHETNRFNCIVAKAKESIILVLVIGACIFQIASEVFSSDPISRIAIFNIALYMSFIVILLVLELIVMILTNIVNANRCQNEINHQVRKILEDNLSSPEKLNEKYQQ